MHSISVLLRQRLGEFKNSLLYKLSSRSASQGYRTNVLKKKKKKRKKKEEKEDQVGGREGGRGSGRR